MRARRRWHGQLGVVPYTPWNTERECSRKSSAKRIAALLDPLPEGRPCIMNFHCPPYASGLDDAPSSMPR